MSISKPIQLEQQQAEVNQPDDAIARGFGEEMAKVRAAIVAAEENETAAHYEVLELHKKLRRLALRLGRHLVEMQRP